MPEWMTSMDEPLSPVGEPLAAPVDEEDHVNGPAGARVMLVLYGDYECPFTRGTYDVIRHLLCRDEIAFRYAYRYFALAGLHPHAANAARA